MKFFLNPRAFAARTLCLVWHSWLPDLPWLSVDLYGGKVLLNQVLSLAARSSSAVERDAFHPALRASYSAAQRER